MTTNTNPRGASDWFDQDYEPDLNWMRQSGEWGLKVRPGKRGLTLDDIQVGSYGYIPDRSENQTGRSRGSTARSTSFKVGGYRVLTKSDIWLANAAGLYEEALQRQWNSATDIPWETVKPLPDDIERAECQLATFLTDIEFQAADVPAKWVADTSPDFFETRMFLVTQMVDESRHLDVFRKRALSNGGGLMQRPAYGEGGVVSGIDMARDFTEMSAQLHVTGEGPVLTMFRVGELMAYNEAEQRMYRLAAQDESRHVAFGVMHLRYIGETEPDRREEIHTYLDDGERFLLTASQNPVGGGDEPTGEAVSILLGGGKDKLNDGHKLAMAINRRQVKEYMQRVKSAGFAERFTNGRASPKLLEMVAA